MLLVSLCEQRRKMARCVSVTLRVQGGSDAPIGDVCCTFKMEPGCSKLRKSPWHTWRKRGRGEPAYKKESKQDYHLPLQHTALQDLNLSAC